MRRRTITFIFIIIFACAPRLSGADEHPLTVFAAASTQQAVETVLLNCPEKLKRSCRGVFAASSTLARQIASGAPADIYISANLKWMTYLVDNRFVSSDGVRVMASNRLVVVAPTALASSLSNHLPDDKSLIDWLARDRIAVGDPAHVPAGIYTEQTLRSLNVWDRLGDRLLRLPNVRAALAVVARAEANAGIVYATDAAVSKDVSIVYRFDGALHDPIRYPIAPVAIRDNVDVGKLMDLFTSAIGKTAFRNAGFEVTKE